jgi:hypothetical protein
MESVARSVNNNKKELIEINSKLQTLNNVTLTQEAKTLNANGYAQVLLTSAGGTAVKADTDCVVQQDPEHREGWYLTNSVAGTKFNLYYFNGTQEAITLGDVLSIYFKGFINNNSETSSIPFFHIYTKPTGSGDAGPWYHSKIDYQYASDNTIGIGEECIFYGGEVPKTLFNNRQIAFNNKTITGEGLDSEEVLYLVVSSNSGASVNAVNVTINLMGFNTDSIFRNFKLLSESSLTGGATEGKQDLMITELEAINTGVGSLDDKITTGADTTLSQAQQVLIYGEVTSGPGTGELHPIHITNAGDVEVEIADFVKGQETSANSFPVTIASDQISFGDGSTQTTLPRNTMYGCYNNTDLRSIKVDSNGRLLTQEEGVRTSGSETLNIPDATTGTSSAITMGTHKFIAFYGDTDNTTNTNIFIEYSQDGVNWFRGAGDNAKIIIVSATGNFYDEEHVTPPRIRISRPNTSGSAETLTLYYTLL